nr:hypothetical protein HK105_000051 [Polyrhizophydium stewartii]
MLYAMHVPAAPAALPHAAAAVPPWHAPVAAAPAPDPALHIAALAAHVPQPVLPQQPAQIPQQAQPVQPAQQPPQPQPQPQPQQPQQGAVGRLLAGIGGLGGALFGLLFLEDDGDAAAEPARPAAQENPVADAAMLLLKLVIIVLFFSQNASFERKLFLWGTAAIVFCLHVAAEPAAAIAANIVGRINALAQLVPANAAAAPPDAAPPNAAPDDAPAPADGPVPDPAPQGDGIPAIAPAIADPSLPMQALQILVSFFVSTVPGFEEPHAPAM